MSTREDALELLQKLSQCGLAAFFNDVDLLQKGSCFVLAYLDQSSGEVMAGDLAKELRVSTARIAVLLKKMEKNGLIARYNSASDARKTVVKITPKGTAYANQVREQLLSKAELLIEKVGKQDLDELIRIFGKVKVALDI